MSRRTLTSHGDKPADSAFIAQAFIEACNGELQALKPGNVHIHAGGHTMEVGHFEDAAAAAAPHIAAWGVKTGARIKQAVSASVAAAGCNTNLGIILLCAPLAVAAEQRATIGVKGDFGDARPDSEDVSRPLGSALRLSLARVLAGLDIEDADNAFHGIAEATPAGLGDAAKEDVHDAPTSTLREAMQIAAHRDRIANCYTTDFADIFEFGLPRFRNARANAESLELATTTLHMNYLAAFPDSHIHRKHGSAAAKLVQTKAAGLAERVHPVATTASFDDLLAFDRELKSARLNPGTTADLVVATLFADTLDSQ